MSERERFEAHAVDRRLHTIQTSDGQYAARETREAWLAWQAAIADQPEPAQPVAQIAFWTAGGPAIDWLNTDSLNPGDKLYAAPPSHPAPSEAAPERQEKS